MARSSDVEYKMRMTQDLKEKIVASAKEHNRSMNADIVARLEQSFASQNPQNSEQIAEDVNKLTTMFEDIWKKNSQLEEENKLLKDKAINKIVETTVKKTIEEFLKNQE